MSWASINIAAIGLQVGVQGFRMLMVLENQDVLAEFQKNKWTGSVGAMAVVGEVGGSGKASFTNGVAVYQGANTGLIASVNIGLNHIKHKPLNDPD